MSSVSENLLAGREHFQHLLQSRSIAKVFGDTYAEPHDKQSCLAEADLGTSTSTLYTGEPGNATRDPSSALYFPPACRQCFSRRFSDGRAISAIAPLSQE